MPAEAPILILGSGMAGYGLAREIRQRGRQIPLLMITANGGEQYPKPQLSAALGKGQGPEQLIIAQSGQASGRLGIELLTHCRARRIAPAQQCLHASCGRFEYRQLVLAVGARPIRLPLAGDGADAVLSINSLDDYRRYRQQLASARAVAIIGPGLIGCEFANDLLQSGRGVTVIGPDPYPMSTILPRSAGAALQQALADAGVGWRLQCTVRQVTKEGNGFQLHLSDGSTLSADLVVSAVGLRPDTELAAEAGLSCDRGILTDRELRTSDPHIFALGDCVQVGGFNLPYVMPLNLQAKALARTLTGEPTRLDYPPMPVLVKTTLHPVVVAAPPPGIEGDWQEEVTAGGVRALFRDPAGALRGMALTGSCTAERQRWLPELQPLPLTD